MYAVGATDKLQGTGVWSFIKAERASGANKDGEQGEATGAEEKDAAAVPRGEVTGRRRAVRARGGARRVTLSKVTWPSGRDARANEETTKRRRGARAA